MPAATPVTLPEEVMVATEDGVQLHTPPPKELLRVIVLPGHTGAFPVIGPGAGVTVTTAVTVPQAVT